MLFAVQVVKAPNRQPDERQREEATSGEPEDPRWARPAAVSLLAATAVLYLWGLGASGWANSFYSAAAQAGSVSWKAFLFGSSDAANSITVDKTPLSLWPMALSIRIFGLNAWSILVPQALEGVAAVGVLYLTVKRWFGATAGLLAGAILALTPVSVLMFRFNNPDSLLVLLTVASAYYLTRALEDGRTRWMVAAGAMVGLGFLTKELQAFVILPVLVGTYLVAGPPRLMRRIVQSFWLGLATLVAGGWWVAVVSLWPASDRPWFGGSQDNTFWNVLFGYNGFGRLTGNESGSVVGGGPGGGVPGGGGGPAGPGRGNVWGATGVTRLFNESFGGQASWLIPAALLVVLAGLIWTARRPRTDRVRAAVLLWGGWLVVTGLVISLSKGIIHEYYTVALAPAIGALVGAGATEAWRHRRHSGARALLAAGVALTAWWSHVLLARTPDWLPWLSGLVVATGVAATLGLLLGGRALNDRAAGSTAQFGATATVVGAMLAVAFAGQGAYALNTARTPHSGSLPTAGPAGRFGMGGPGGGRFGGPGRGNGGVPQGGGVPAFPGGLAPGGVVPGGGGFPGGPGTFGPGGGGLPGGNPGGTNGGFSLPTGGLPGAGGANGGGNRAGGLLQGSEPSAELTALLEKGADEFDWIAATVGANSASGYQLATERPVMPIGGFNGTDPSPTLTQFKAYVSEGRIHYFIAGGGGVGGPGGSETSSEITTWVQQTFTSRTVGGVTVYDLTDPTA
ncbi:MAG: glycosyltransferase family 39 protein [Acidimicrobiales bacterium]|nr:glycosyltransferase family 39 protein [Acidimicrobiales bacterium]